MSAKQVREFDIKKSHDRLARINTRHVKRWLEILCATNEKTILFEKYYTNEGTDLTTCLKKFQNELRNERSQGKDILINEAVKVLKGHNTLKTVIYTLQKIFMIPIYDDEARSLISLSNRVELGSLLEAILAASKVLNYRVVSHCMNSFSFAGLSGLGQGHKQKRTAF